MGTESHPQRHGSELFFERRALRLIAATASELGIPYPTSAADELRALRDAVERDDTFVSEEHPKFAVGYATIVTTYGSFSHYYARLDRVERAATVADALAMLNRTTTE